MNKITLELDKADIQETFEVLCEIPFENFNNLEWERAKGIEQLIKQLDKYVYIEESGEI